MKLSKAIEGFLISCTAGNYAPSTVSLHSMNLKLLTEFLHNPEIEAIREEDLQRYMLYLRTEYKPKRLYPSDKPYSDAARDNHWKSIRSLFRFASETLELKRPDLNLKQPRYEIVKVVPFSEDEIKALLAACEKVPATKEGKPYTISRRTAVRDKALLLTLLDTGVRVGELCRIELQDINQQEGEILIRPYSTGRKTKSRFVYLGKNARKVMWRYLASLDILKHDHVFPMSENTIRALLWRIGKQANVDKVHPHRFRHTFAVWYLRGGGDVFTLQRLLGHSSLDMVEHYLSIVREDIQNTHRMASPADRIRV
jgi:integrase/recombinase XerD